MCFLETDATLRTDESFANRLDVFHHKNQSIAEEIIQMISQLPLDVMHLCYKGVMGKLFDLWLHKFKILSSADKSNIDIILREMASNQPEEFGRTIRTLDSINFWKASELRTFVLYIGPLILKKFLSLAAYRNFMFFSLAMRIYTRKEFSSYYDIADHFSKNFFDTYVELYGQDEATYNIHVFLHLGADVRLHGPCESFSCFQYESFLYSVKLLVHSPNYPIVQLFNRVKEVLKASHIPNIETSHPKIGLHLVRGVWRYYKNSQKFENTFGNEFVLLNDGSIFQIELFHKSASEIFSKGLLYKKQHLVSLFNYPCKGRFLQMLKFKKRDHIPVKTTVNVKDFCNKLFTYKTSFKIYFIALSL